MRSYANDTSSSLSSVTMRTIWPVRSAKNSLPVVKIFLISEYMSKILGSSDLSA